MKEQARELKEDKEKEKQRQDKETGHGFWFCCFPAGS